MYLRNVPHRPLTEEQAAALRALDWLHNPHARGEGRTYVLALSYLRRAIDYRDGAWLVVEDHHDGRQADHNLLLTIIDIAAQYGARLEVLPARRSFRMGHLSNRLRTFLDSLLSPVHNAEQDFWANVSIMGRDPWNGDPPPMAAPPPKRPENAWEHITKDDEP